MRCVGFLGYDHIKDWNVCRKLSGGGASQRMRLIRNSGMTILETTIALSVSIILITAASSYLTHFRQVSDIYDAQNTRNMLRARYAKLLEKDAVRTATVAGNPDLLAYVKPQSDVVPLVLGGPLKVVDDKGKVLIPDAGLYLDAQGRAASASDYFWKINATWTGIGSGTFKTNVSMVRNPGATVHNLSLADKANLSYETTRTECFTVNNVTGSRVYIPGVGLNTFYVDRFGYTPGFYDPFGNYVVRPPDSQLTKATCKCPVGTMMMAIKSLPGCGSASVSAHSLAGDATLSADEQMRMGRSQQFTSQYAEYYCTTSWGVALGSAVWKNGVSLDCEAVCCRFNL